MIEILAVGSVIAMTLLLIGVVWAEGPKGLPFWERIGVIRDGKITPSVIFPILFLSLMSSFCYDIVTSHRKWEKREAQCAAIPTAKVEGAYCVDITRYDNALQQLEMAKAAIVESRINLGED